MQRFLILTLFLLLCSCASNPPQAKQNPENNRFEAFSESYLHDWLEAHPQGGVALGLHEYDGRFTHLTRAAIESEIARLKKASATLDFFQLDSLSQQHKMEARLLKTAIAGDLFGLLDQKAPWRNPMTYAGALDVNIYIKRDFAPLPNRVRSLMAILSQAHDHFANARANLEERLPKPFVETAIEVARGSADFLSKELVEAVKPLKDRALFDAFSATNKTAVEEIRAFATYLEKEKLPKAVNDFALGREAYIRMLRENELVDLPPERILKIGLDRLHLEQQQFAEAAKIIDPTKKPIEVFKAIQKDHPTAAGLIPDTRKNLEGIRQFLIDHQIISMPSSVRARVEETPQYARATSFASMDTPGPFETKATQAYYYVTPTEKEWSVQQKEEWLTAFNYYTTDVVTIHEAYPGHYTQFLHLNASKASKVQKIFTSYPFVEGWAHYTEQMLIENGFGQTTSKNPSREEQIRAAKYRMAQLDESLLRLCRLCSSIKLHCQGMNVDEATRFFVDNCYYEEKPAHQEAIRGTFDPGYLYYTVGKLQIIKLREDYKRQQGAAFTLKAFHDEMLRHGAPPLRLMRELLLKDPAAWPQIL